MEKLLDEQLKRLNIDCIDYYLIHAVDLKAINRLIKRDLFKFIKKAKADGKIKHIGFSYHGPKEEFREVVDIYDWEIVMVQYNYFDENVQASSEGTSPFTLQPHTLFPSHIRESVHSQNLFP